MPALVGEDGEAERFTFMSENASESLAGIRDDLDRLFDWLDAGP